MLDKTTTRALPVLNRTAELAPAAQACCGACRTCVTTNALGIAALVGTALASRIANLRRRARST